MSRCQHRNPNVQVSEELSWCSYLWPLLFDQVSTQELCPSLLNGNSSIAVPTLVGQGWYLMFYLLTIVPQFAWARSLLTEVMWARCFMIYLVKKLERESSNACIWFASSLVQALIPKCPPTFKAIWQHLVRTQWAICHVFYPNWLTIENLAGQKMHLNGMCG